VQRYVPADTSLPTGAGSAIYLLVTRELVSLNMSQVNEMVNVLAGRKSLSVDVLP
jgi:hypothetical protein